MTVTYTAEVATGQGFGTFLKLLARWRGSVYKLVWKDLMLFLTFYFVLSLTYRFFLTDSYRNSFEDLVRYCESFGNLLPLSFVLGFYVTIVMERWWDQYITIPWPDSIAVFVSSHIHGQDERGRVMRRTIMRYVCLCQAMALSLISPRVKKRFRTSQHLVDAGLMLDNEREVIDGFDKMTPNYPKHWMPIIWASSIVTRARKEGRIRDDFSVKTIIDALNVFRGLCGVLMHYDTISVPLVYTQVVTVGTYSYFLTQVIGQQWIKKQEPSLDLYFPYFTILQFFFYMGWLKVAEVLINPFGDDEDDFEVNWMIDRNLQVSYLIVDEMHHEHPELVKDQYWDEVFPQELPYHTDKREAPPETSTAKLDFKQSTVEMESTAMLNGHAVSRLNSEQKLHKSASSYVDLERAPSIEARTSKKPPSTKASGTVRIIDEKYVEGDDISNSSEQHQEQPQLLRILELFRRVDTAGQQQSDTSLVQPRSESEATDIKMPTDSKITSVADIFERLRKERQLERMQRMKGKWLRSIGNVADLTVTAKPSASQKTSEEYFELVEDEEELLKAKTSEGGLEQEKPIERLEEEAREDVGVFEEEEEEEEAAEEETSS